MDDFKEALIYAIEHFESGSKIALMNELIMLFYSTAYSDGQVHMLERMKEDD